LLTNRSYCHYTVEIKKGTVPIPSAAGNYWILPRSTHTSITWTWPPDRKNQVAANIGGAGEFVFKFSKNSKLSIFDGFMTLAGTVIGAGASTYEELSEGYKMLSTTGGGLLEMINKAAVAEVNSAADARKLADELLFSSGKIGFDLLMDFAPKYFGAKLKQQFKQSWFRTAARLLASKAFIWGVAAYNTTEVALIIYDVSNAPDSYEELGWQTSVGWYGDLFARKIDEMKKMKLIFSLPVSGMAFYKDGTSAATGEDGVLTYNSPLVAVSYESVDKEKRELKNVVFNRIESDYRQMRVSFPSLKFTAFKDRENGNVFDENRMEFVWGNPSAGFISIDTWMHTWETPYIADWPNLDHWSYTSTSWSLVTNGMPYYAGIILAP
jgi:hypothetical protein